jgi:hypothetical protein
MTSARRFAVLVAMLVCASVGCQPRAPAPTGTSIPSGIAASGAAPSVQVPSPTPLTATTPPSLTPTSTPVSSPPSGGKPWGPFSATGLDGRADPDPLLTPGSLNPDVTQANLDSTICASGYTARIRPPASYTNRLKIVQIVEYGYADTAPSDYEEDHLISLELGGNPRDPANLWPEPHVAPLPDGTPAGASVKDSFENFLRRGVCKGSITLGSAQHAIATDWVAAWMAAGTP